MMTIKFQLVNNYIQNGEDQVPASLPSHSRWWRSSSSLFTILFKMVMIKFQNVYHYIQDDDDQVPASLPSH